MAKLLSTGYSHHYYRSAIVVCLLFVEKSSIVNMDHSTDERVIKVVTVDFIYPLILCLYDTFPLVSENNLVKIPYSNSDNLSYTYYADGLPGERYWYIYQ